jgi:Zn-dependent peptidase ImmA (M78 family)
LVFFCAFLLFPFVSRKFPRYFTEETQVTETERFWNIISSFLMVYVASTRTNIFQQQWYKRLALLKDKKKAEEMDSLVPH